MRIVISGYYGFGNLGDDMILGQSIDLIRAMSPDAQITVITYPEADTEVVHRTTGLTAIDGASVDRCNQVIAAADLVLIGGGGLIQDHLPSDPAFLGTASHNNLVFWTSIAMMAAANGVPVSTWFIGVGPLDTAAGREQASTLFSMMHLVCVRDDASAALAEECGVDPKKIVVGADPVFVWKPHERRVEQQTVAVVMRRWEGVDRWLAPIAGALDRLVQERSVDVVFVPFQSGRGGIEADETLALRLASRISHVTRRRVVEPWVDDAERLKTLVAADAVLGMRLHSIITAAAAAVPTVALSYDPKVDAVMHRLGRSNHVVALASDPDADWLFERLASALDESITSSVVEELRTAARDAAERVLSHAGSAAAMPPDMVPVIVAGLAATSVENRDLKARLAAALEDLDRQVAELDSVRAEFQEFRDSRVVRMAQAVWGGRRAARQAVETARGWRDRETSEPVISLTDVMEATSGALGHVVFAPGIHWNVELFQRPQQMARAFAELGYAVLYQVDEQYRDDLEGYRRVEDGIYEGYVADTDVESLGAVKDPLLLSYVYNFDWRAHLENPVTVYEHIDHLDVFAHFRDRTELEAMHRRAMSDADIVVGSARDLMAQLTPERADALLVPNGAEVTHFQTSAPVPPDLAHLVETDTPIVGYYGALAEWFDYQLIADVAKRLPDHAFVLIGPDYDGTMGWSGLADIDNVHWLGPRPYGELPAYLQAFDVATIPFHVSEVTHAVSPLKLFEYMAGGKPVVTSPLRECAAYPQVMLAEGVEEWVEMIERARSLGGDAEFREAQQTTAAGNTWISRAETIIAAWEGLDR